MTVAEVPRRPPPTGGYDFDALAGDLGKLRTSTAHTSTWGGLDRRPGHTDGGIHGCDGPRGARS
jgi:hypothetical protein